MIRIHLLWVAIVIAISSGGGSNNNAVQGATCTNESSLVAVYKGLVWTQDDGNNDYRRSQMRIIAHPALYCRHWERKEAWINVNLFWDTVNVSTNAPRGEGNTCLDRTQQDIRHRTATTTNKMFINLEAFFMGPQATYVGQDGNFTNTSPSLANRVSTLANVLRERSVRKITQRPGQDLLLGTINPTSLTTFMAIMYQTPAQAASSSCRIGSRVVSMQEPTVVVLRDGESLAQCMNAQISPYVAEVELSDLPFNQRPSKAPALIFIYPVERTSAEDLGAVTSYADLMVPYPAEHFDLAHIMRQYCFQDCGVNPGWVVHYRWGEAAHSSGATDVFLRPDGDTDYLVSGSYEERLPSETAPRVLGVLSVNETVGDVTVDPQQGQNLCLTPQICYQFVNTTEDNQHLYEHQPRPFTAHDKRMLYFDVLRAVQAFRAQAQNGASDLPCQMRNVRNHLFDKVLAGY